MRRDIEEGITRRSHVAEQDQMLATALDRLRGCQFFVLATMDENFVTQISALIPDVTAAESEDDAAVMRAVGDAFLEQFTVKVEEARQHLYEAA